MSLELRICFEFSAWYLDFTMREKNMRSGICFVAIAMVTICASALAYDFSTNPGDGSPENPYQISEPNQLMSIGSDPTLLDKHFILTNDIVFDPENNPTHVFTEALIAPDTDNANTGFQGIPFSGTFDGTNHEISYLTIVNAGTKDFIGLFGYINCENESIEVIKDLKLFGTYIDTESDYVGSLAGCLEYGTLRNCITKFSSFQGVETGLVRGNEKVGGLVGYSQSANINNSSYSGDVFGTDMVGGIVGWIYSGLIRNCISSGNIYGFNMVGGIAGRSGTGKGSVAINGQVATVSIDPGTETAPSNITNCQSNAYVSGHYFCGGLIGFHSWGCVAKSFGDVLVRGYDMYCGGLVGITVNAEVQNCYVNIDMEGNNPSAGFMGVVANSSIENSYCTGTVDTLGGGYGYMPRAFVGDYLDIWGPSTISNCFFHETLGAPDTNPTQLSEEEMKQQANFVGWDFLGEDVSGDNEIWRMCVDGVDYPRLSWEFTPNGDFACGDGVGIEDIEQLGQCWLSALDLPTELDDDSDNIVSLSETARLGQYWLQTDCGTCGGIDITGDGDVLVDDLTEIINDWLRQTYPACVTCDANGDEQIDLQDFSVLSQNWQ